MTSSDHEQDHSSTMNSEFGGYQYDGSSFQFEVPAYQAANRPAISAPPRPSITLPQETFPTSAHQGPMAYPNSSDSSYEYYRGISGGTPSMLSYRGLTMGYSVNASVPPYNVAASKWHLGGPESTYHSPNVNLSVGRTGPSYYHSLDTQYLASMYSSRPSFPGHTDYGGLQSSTMISAYTRTDSESSPVSTATNGVRIADQSLSPNNGQSEAMFQRPLRQLTPKLVLAQPARTQPSNYGPMNPALVQTRNGDSGYHGRGRKRDATAQSRPSWRPTRLATSCDLCKKQRAKCERSVPDEQRCDNCRRRAKKCTFRQRDESNNRPMWGTTVPGEPPV